jgi:hypothetical protein
MNQLSLLWTDATYIILANRVAISNNEMRRMMIDNSYASIFVFRGSGETDSGYSPIL